MPSYNIYAPTGLSFSGGTISLASGYSPLNDVVVLDVTDNDSTFEGDLWRNEVGNDSSQFGTLRDLTGNVIGGGPTTRVYLEETYTLTGSDGSTIHMWRVELQGGRLAGYIIDQPLQPGISYSYTVANVTPWNDPLYADLGSVPICFTPGSLIRTPEGNRPVESLKLGDLVVTRDHGACAILWIGRRDVSDAELAASPALRPVRVAAGALGPGLPERDMLVSPQHRFVLRGPGPVLLFGHEEMLAPAKALCAAPRIAVAGGLHTVSYIHILFDRHEIVWADGVETESFHPGRVGIGSLDVAQRAELFEIFPGLAALPDSFGPAARPALRVNEARLLADPASPRYRV